MVRKGLGLLAGLVLGIGIAGRGLEAKAQSSVTPSLPNGWTNNASINWNWATQHMVKAFYVGGGTGSVSGVDSENYAYQGSNVTLTAIADAHRHFEFWTGIPSAYTNNPNPTFPVDAAYTNATAHFGIDQVTITQSSPYSAVTWSTTNVDYGSTDSLTIGTATNQVQIGPASRVKRVGATLTGNQGTVNP